MRVEVDQGQRAVPPCSGAQQRECDRVVAADGDQPTAALEQRVRPGLDLRHRLFGAEGRAGDVTGVDDLGQLEGERVLRRVVRPQQAGALAHRGRAEAGTRAVARPAVEGDADDARCPSATRRPQWAVGRRWRTRRSAGPTVDGVGRRSDGPSAAVRHQSSMAW